MMKNFLHIIILSALPVCIAGCHKTETAVQESSRIEFYGRSVFLQAGTKGIVPDENFTQSIYVTDDTEENPIFNHTEIKFHEENGLWYTEDARWSDRQYRFYAYIRSQGTTPAGTGGGTIEIEEDLSTPGRSSGTHFTVSQPESYPENEDAFADFLLSYPVSVDGADKPLVTLDFERTMACVELYMDRTQNNPEVTVTSVRFAEVYKSAVYSLYSHGDGDRNGMKNVWQVIESGRSDYVFTGEKSLADRDAGERFDEQYLVMRFLVPDQDLDEKHILTVTYRASESAGGSVPAENTATFALSGYDINTWAYGHKIRYYITIDTGASMEGVVDQWRNVDYIEGTFLPD